MKYIYFSVARDPEDNFSSALDSMGATPMGLGTDGATYGACPDAIYKDVAALLQHAGGVIQRFDDPDEPYGVCVSG